MNIHIQDEQLFKSLKQATVVELEVGSALYGLKDEASDTDVLCIYIPSVNKVNSFINLHHVLQYKDTESRTDYIFEDVFSFVRNCLSGDSSLNFEALHTEDLQRSELSFLYDQRKAFYNYNIAKAYLGFGRRDRKFLSASLTAREQAKKLAHIYRSYLFCQSIVQGDLVLNDQRLIEAYPRYLQMTFEEKAKVADGICTDIEAFRKDVLNIMLEQKRMVRFMDEPSQQRLDQSLNAFCLSDSFKQKQLEFRDLSLFYKANEYGVNY